MARPREFDTNDVLMRAMATFWQHGYVSTSINDLCNATGLKKGSLYQAFGDKHTLFIQVLQMYLGTVQDTLRDALSAPTPLREGLLDGTEALFRTLPPDGPQGCFAVNATVELGPHDDLARSLLERHHETLVEILAEAVARAQQSGDIRSQRPADDLARFLHVVFCGMGVDFRRGRDRDMPPIYETALAALDG